MLLRRLGNRRKDLVLADEHHESSVYHGEGGVVVLQVLWRETLPANNKSIYLKIYTVISAQYICVERRHLSEHFNAMAMQFSLLPYLVQLAQWQEWSSCDLQSPPRNQEM